MTEGTINRRKFLCSIAMVLMFLFADLALPSAMPQWNNNILDDDNSVNWASTYSNVTADTAINSGNPESGYGYDQSFDIGANFTGDSRMLISVSNNYTSSDIINSALLELTCEVNSTNLDDINFYAARLKKSWDENNSTWNGPTS
ncbi:MAG: hypothetical protein VYC12_06410, partial [Candidatus Thermoplasmatota archaeon]|nr:hypothetical protein [Candidatus Thermoplasmatota archaeon]